MCIGSLGKKRKRYIYLYKNKTINLQLSCSKTWLLVLQYLLYFKSTRSIPTCLLGIGTSSLLGAPCQIHKRNPRDSQLLACVTVLLYMLQFKIYTGCHFWKLYHLPVQRNKNRSEIWHRTKKNIASRLNKWICNY